MLKRRDFLKTAGASAAMLFSRHSLAAQAATGASESISFSSPNMELELSPAAPEFFSLNIDGLGKGRRGVNIVTAQKTDVGYNVSASNSNGVHRVEYRAEGAPAYSPAMWTFVIADSRILLTSQWSGEFNPPPIIFHFDLNQVHSTVLGLFSRTGLLAPPALLHFPGQGSIQLSSSALSLELTYTSDRQAQSAMLSLPGANFVNQRVDYTLDITAIYPDVPGIAADERFDAFRRNWLNALQLNPSLQALANNTASDSCAFCYYEFADIAALAPPLSGNLTALDIVRQTLDGMLAGGLAYGMPVAPDHPTTTSDTFPSLVIAAANCARAGHSDDWLAANYDGIRGWVESMLTSDSNGDGLIKYSNSGNSGIWSDGSPKIRPSNWWDTIGFGYEDAYANALAYRAYRDMAMMAARLNNSGDAARYQAAAGKLRAVYYDRFFDPATGVLSGWRSADGQLHDYYFLFVSGIAIHYGLVTRSQANSIMDKLLAKMKAVGYNNFSLGLPGNLITVPLKDYVHRTPDARYGGGVLPDNSDGFQNYENGGATGAYAFFTLAALYDLGRAADADKILFPMLDEYGRCGFEGKDTKGRSNDWRRWDGTAMGYEGLLADDYYTMLAVPLRQSETPWQDGYRPPTPLS